VDKSEAFVSAGCRDQNARRVRDLNRSVISAE
jgi:hypothetical protein